MGEFTSETDEVTILVNPHMVEQHLKPETRATRHPLFVGFLGLMGFRNFAELHLICKGLQFIHKEA